MGSLGVGWGRAGRGIVSPGWKVCSSRSLWAHREPPPVQVELPAGFPAGLPSMCLDANEDVSLEFLLVQWW